MSKNQTSNASTNPDAAAAAETNYLHEEAAGGIKAFFGKRWVRVTGISLAAAIALVGAFGVGVVAGERISGDRGGFSSAQNGGQFGGFGHDDGGQFGNGQGRPQGAFPGGCPADDPDHCAGTDRNQHDFQVPGNGTTGSNSQSSSGKTTSKS